VVGARAIHLHGMTCMTAMGCAAEHGASLRRTGISGCKDRQRQSQERENKAKSLEASRVFHGKIFMQSHSFTIGNTSTRNRSVEQCRHASDAADCHFDSFWLGSR
jgi:hypothetical protein